jgi:hypothetical protein
MVADVGHVALFECPLRRSERGSAAVAASRAKRAQGREQSHKVHITIMSSLWEWLFQTDDIELG